MIQESGTDSGHVERLHFQELFDFAPEGYLLTDFTGLIQRANHEAAALFKIRRDFLIDKPLGMFVLEPGRKLIYSYLTRLSRRIASGADAFGEWQVWLQPPRASPMAVNLHVTVLSTESGFPQLLRWRVRDVTAHLHVERDRQAAKSLSDTLIETARAAILVLDARGRILRCNRFLLGMLGYDEKELNGREWATLLVPEERARGAQLLEESLHRKVGFDCLARIPTRDGQTRTMSWSGKGLELQEERAAAAVVLGYDITELQAAQHEAMQTARLAAIGEVMTGLTHESRNALQRTRACLDRLRWRLPDTPEVTDLLDRANQAVVEMTTLFEDVRSYAAPMRLEMTRCHLQEIWREAWAHLSNTTTAELIESVEEPLWLLGDRNRLVRVFRNLFENAVQARGQGCRVEVTCRMGNRAGKPALRVSVCDNGPGLGATLGQIFAPFFTTKPTGTGIGLAIVRRVLEAHGGTITAANRDAGGAEFTILLPRELP